MGQSPHCGGFRRAFMPTDQHSTNDRADSIQQEGQLNGLLPYNGREWKDDSCAHHCPHAVWSNTTWSCAGNASRAQSAVITSNTSTSFGIALLVRSADVQLTRHGSGQGPASKSPGLWQRYCL